MVTYLIGTDGPSASEAICDFLAGEVDEKDRLEVINAQRGSGSDADAVREGRTALELVEERLGNVVSVTTHQLTRGQKPSEELLAMADEVDADRIVIGLRRHSRTERIIFGSVAQALLKRTTRPVTLVPLPEYQVSSAGND